jgi:hypothetical protein
MIPNEKGRHLQKCYGTRTEGLKFMNWPRVILLGLMINYVVFVIPTGQGLCIEADSHTRGLTFYGQLRPDTVFTGLDTDPIEFTPHLHNRAVLRYVVFMLPSVSTFLEWPLLYNFSN